MLDLFDRKFGTCYMVLMKELRLPDIDVIYYDPTNVDERVEKNHEEALNRLLSNDPLVSQKSGKNAYCE